MLGQLQANMHALSLLKAGVDRGDVWEGGVLNVLLT